jgi:TrmH family RNA methyltransferase
MITSNQNPKIQKIRALLQQSKARKNSGLFVIEGVRLSEEAIQANWKFEFVLYSDNLSDRGLELLHKAAEQKIDIEEIPFSLMKKIGDTEHPQGIIGVIRQEGIQVPSSPNFVLICDAISDPGNLGTILRSADAAKVQAVIISPNCTDPFSPKVVRAGMGAHFHLPIIQFDWQEIKGFCKKGVNPLITYIASAEAALNCWDADLKEPCAIIVGSEASGPGDEAYELADVQIRIPMPGSSESLNASVAASILLFETIRQRWK